MKKEITEYVAICDSC
jgi:hypothetical protein